MIQVKILAQDVMVLTMLKLRADTLTSAASSEGLDAYFVARFVFFPRYHAPSTQPRFGTRRGRDVPDHSWPAINKKTTRTGSVSLTVRMLVAHKRPSRGSL